MIEKLDKFDSTEASIYHVEKLYAKVNQLVDAVNELQLAKDVMFNRIDRLNDAMCDMRKRITALEDPTYHKAEPADPYAELCKWIGKVCWFWDDDNTNSSCGILTSIDTETFKEPQFVCNDEYDYEHCKPVSPDDDIIYKGEQQ